MTFLEFDFSKIIVVLKVLGLMATAGFIYGIIYSILGIMKTRDKKREERENYFKVKTNNISEKERRWLDIKAHFQSKNSTDWRMAIIDADSMLEEFITSMGYNAPTFGEKLKMIRRSDFPAIDSVWHVHKLRNALAHNGSSYALSEREAYQAYKIYENIFYESGYLS